MSELTGITSLPIPSAGINPILSGFVAAATVPKERKAMRKPIFQNNRVCRLQFPRLGPLGQYRVTRVNYGNVTRIYI